MMCFCFTVSYSYCGSRTCAIWVLYNVVAGTAVNWINRFCRLWSAANGGCPLDYIGSIREVFDNRSHKQLCGIFASGGS